MTRNNFAGVIGGFVLLLWGLPLRAQDDNHPVKLKSGDSTGAGLVDRLVVTKSDAPGAGGNATVRIVRSADADAVTTLRSSNIFELQGAYWNAVSTNYGFRLRTILESTAPTARLSFQNNAGTEIFVIDESGNVGIGTVNPGVKLDVAGGISATGTISGAFSGSGAALTGLNASVLASGTVPLARLGGITSAELAASAGITNAQLANSSVTVAAGIGLSGGGSVALGGTTTLNLANTTVAAGGYGSASSVATFTVDAQGRLTAAANASIAVDASAVATGTLLDSRLSANVMLLGSTQMGAGQKVFSPTTDITGLVVRQTSAVSPTSAVFAVQNNAGTATFLGVNASGNVSLSGDLSVSGAMSVTGGITGPNVTSGADPGHTHTGGSLSGVVTLQATTPGTAQTGNLNVTGTAIAGSFSGSGASLTNLNASNVASGTLTVPRGGTGAASFTAGRLLFGNGTGALGTSANLFWNNTIARLGIGTTAPGGPLHVVSPTATVIIERNDASAGLAGPFVFSRTRNDAIAPAAGFGVQFGYQLEGATNGSVAQVAEIRAVWEVNQTDDIGARDAYLAIHTMQDNVLAERLRITSAGNVGIGTTSPSGALTVATAANIYAGRFLVQDAATTTVLDCLSIDRDTSNANNGAAGIGSALLFRAENSANIMANAAGIAGILTTATHLNEKSALTFSTRTGGGALSERVRIDDGGNVGIGTTDPGAAKLRINVSNIGRGVWTGDVAPYLNSTPGFNTNLSAPGRHFTASENSSVVFIVSGGGNVGIGTSTFGTGAARVLGLANATAPTTSPVDMVQLYAGDVGTFSELKVRDEAGNVSVLSPHNFSLVGRRSEEMAWSFYSERGTKKINVDMLRVVREVERLSGKRLVYLGEGNCVLPAEGIGEGDIARLRAENARLQEALSALSKRLAGIEERIGK